MLQTFTLGTFAQGVSGGGGGASFESIASVTATGGETSLSFTSIPGTYQHLQIRGIARDTTTTNSALYLTIRFNSDSGSNYAYHRLFGDGSAAAATAQASVNSVRLYGGMDYTLSTNIYATNIIDIHDYASTTKNKTVRALSGCDGNTSSTSFIVTASSGLWMNTSAITTITFGVSDTAFAAGSTFALYGIRGA